MWTICKDVKLLLVFLLFRCRFLLLLFCQCRGTQHFTGTVSNEATSEMGYPAWPAGRSCISFISSSWDVANPRTTKPFPTNCLSVCTVFAI